MRKTIFILTAIIALATILEGQSPKQKKWETYMQEQGIIINSDEHCGTITFPREHKETEPREDEIPTEPLNVYFFVEEGVEVTEEIEDSIRKCLAIDTEHERAQGNFAGTGKAFKLVGWEHFDPQPFMELGLNMTTSNIAMIFAKINPDNEYFRVYDSLVIQARECYNIHKIIIWIKDSHPGAQEATLVDGENNEGEIPTEAYKVGAYGDKYLRYHAITHGEGGNHQDHEDGPDITRHPIRLADGRTSYGWSTVGLDGYSGGASLGEGENGENLASHIRKKRNKLLRDAPHLKAQLVAAPDTLQRDQAGTFEAGINKDIGEEVWQWQFTNTTSSEVVVVEEKNPQVSFSTEGKWEFTAGVSNACGGQTDTLSGSFVVVRPSATNELGAETIKIYPNPTKSSVQIDGNLVVKKVALIDLQGRKRKEVSSRSISLEDMPVGIYFLKITTEQGNLVRKVFKQ